MLEIYVPLRGSFVRSILSFYPFVSFMMQSDVVVLYLSSVLLTLIIRAIQRPELLDLYGIYFIFTDHLFVLGSQDQKEKVLIVAKHSLPSLLTFLPHPASY